MNNNTIQSGGIKEKGTGLFGWGPSNAYWGKEFEKFTLGLGTRKPLEQKQLRENPTRNIPAGRFSDHKDFSIVLEDGEKLKEIKKFLKSESGERRISELKLYSISEELATGHPFTATPYPIGIKVEESRYLADSNNPEEKQKLLDRVQKVYDLFKDVMTAIPSGEGAGRRLDELIAKVNDYLYGDSHDINLLSLSHGEIQTQYRPDSSLDWTDDNTDEFKIWSSRDGMLFSVGDVLYWLISYLEFYKSFPLEGKGKKLDGSEMSFNWKQMDELYEQNPTKIIEEQEQTERNKDSLRMGVWLHYLRTKREIIMKNRKEYIKKSLERDGATKPSAVSDAQIGATLKQINNTWKLLPLWYFNSTYEKNPGEMSDEVLETYLNKYATIIRQRNEAEAEGSAVVAELSGEKQGEGNQSITAPVNVDSDSDTDSEDEETVPAGSKLADVELDTISDPNAEKIKILKKLNFAEIPVPDDGDCLFESMALFLKHKFADGSDITNKQLRKQIVDEIHDNWDQYKEFIMLREDCTDEENKESPEQLNNWCKTRENYKKMMMVTRDSDGNFPAWYVPKARFGGLEEVKVFTQLYNIGANVWVIDEADKKLSNPASYPIEGRPTANFLFDPVKGHYSLLDNLQVPFPSVRREKLPGKAKPVSTGETGGDEGKTGGDEGKTGGDEGKTGTPETTDIVVAATDKRLFFDEYLEWLKTAHPRA